LSFGKSPACFRGELEKQSDCVCAKKGGREAEFCGEKNSVFNGGGHTMLRRGVTQRGVLISTQAFSARRRVKYGKNGGLPEGGH